MPALLEVMGSRGAARRPNKPIECGIYVQSFGFDLRAGYGGDDVIRTQWARAVDEGRELAAEWRQACVDKGFTELINGRSS